MAGYAPETHPTKIERKINHNSFKKSIVTVIFSKLAIMKDATNDSITPKIPPISETAPDSITNSNKTRLLLAPIDFLMPIS